MAKTSTVSGFNLTEFFDNAGSQFRNLNPNEPGQWPVLPKIATWALACVAVVAVGWFGLLSAAHAAALRRGVAVHVGGIYSSDTFYDERQDLWDQLRRHGCLCVEMEAAELYTLAARYGRRSLAVLTMSDHILTGEAMSSAERETGFGAMVELALEAAFG